jgi:RNA polymerase sigma factor (sigma-70 family)
VAGGAGHRVSDGPGDPHELVTSGVVPGGDDAGRRVVEATWRLDSARIVAALARYTGDFALAEDVASEALAEALVAWPRDGVPRDPTAWLLTTGRRRAIDAFRRRSGRDERYAVLGRDLTEGGAHAGGAPVAEDDPDLLWDPDVIDDDRLALIFTACHPVLSKEARVALTLRVVGGLSSEEIARAFLVPVATVQARITRAKKTLAAARVPFEVPPEAERAERLGSVLHVVYLIFTEGSSATSGDDWMRADLAREAVRLARVLSRLVPHEPEAAGLLALLELTAARFGARTGPDGEPVLLADQDRRRWDASAVRRGRAALRRAVGAGRGLGPYGLQAAIAEQHDVARSVAETSARSPRRPSWNSTGPSRCRWRPARRRRWSWSTTSSPGRCCPVPTCCPASGASCWRSSAARPRRA